MNEKVAERVVDTPVYTNFTGQFINGQWRAGRTGKTNPDLDPYTGQAILNIVLADSKDLDDAFQAAQRAQRSWASALPSERAAVFRRAAIILETRKDEIISWLIREAGSTRIKANLEWQSVLAMTHEATSFPYRVNGRILPIELD